MKTIAVWFSCGAASAVAAKLTVDEYRKTHNILIVNNPIKEEDEDNIRFKDDVSKWINYPIISAINKDYPSCSIVDVFNKRKYMSGVNGAPCSMLLKKEARYQFEKNNNIDYHVLGFTIDEKDRHDRFTKFERANVIPTLIKNKITKFNCFDIVHQNNIKLPAIYSKGFPNANCIGCVKSQSPTYWNLVRKEYPLIFNERVEQSRRIGCRLVKRGGEHIFLDELKVTDTGGVIKSWDCGIFCDIELY
jgi:hypothetical protein